MEVFRLLLQCMRRTEKSLKSDRKVDGEDDCWLKDL